MKLTSKTPDKEPEKTGSPQPAEAMSPAPQVIGSEQVQNFTRVLQKYKSGKGNTERRIIDSESWWKLRNTREEQKSTNIGKNGGFTSVSGWLHNVIVSKHADAMEAFPEPNILPREAGDRGEAKILTAIVPCVLEQNDFEKSYSEEMWQKLKTGTGAYKVIWDSGKLNGLGDIGIECVNLLNLYWEPGVKDIQRSRYFFHTELFDKDLLQELFPELKDKLNGKSIVSSQFLYDDHVDTENKATVIEVYYHKYSGGKKILHYCKYVDDVVLFATENDPQMAQSGLYDHGKYPYVFDPLFPIEGSPCGYGYVDICRNPQTEIDILKSTFVENAMAGAKPRFFKRSDGNVNVEQFLDLSNTLVDVNGNLGEDALRQIPYTPLDSNYLNMLDRTIQELRETSGNTETSTGSTSSGVTAASAIAALQEASGKGSRDSTQASYRAYKELVYFCIELIRQFYDMPRQFRITGSYGQEEYITYSNAGIQPQYQGTDFGVDMGYRLPVFDIKVSAQKRNVYTKVTQNELALQFYQLGFFNPQTTDQTLMCLDMMDFDGKDQIQQRVAQQGTIYQKLIQYMQMALMLAHRAAPDMVQGLSNDILQTMGGSGASAMAGAAAEAAPNLEESDALGGMPAKDHGIVRNARERSNEAAQPEAGRVIGRKGEKK